jgi:propionyl-CoA synthetase
VAAKWWRYKPLDEAIRLSTHQPTAVVMVDRGLAPIWTWWPRRDHVFRRSARQASECQVPCEPMQSTDISYTIYTSGTTRPRACSVTPAAPRWRWQPTLKHIF